MKRFWKKYVREPIKKWWNRVLRKIDLPDTIAPPAEPEKGPDETPAPTGDAVKFSQLKWVFGGMDGSRARQDVLKIADLGFGSNGLSYRWAGPTLESWDLKLTQADAIACVFFKNNDGKWVGGKFDWISTSRTTRSFNNIRDGYKGWSLADIPNPTQGAFVIISSSGKLRTNVLAAKWER